MVKEALRFLEDSVSDFAIIIIGETRGACVIARI